MKRSAKIFIVFLVIFLVLCHIDMLPWFYERQREYLNRVDETRMEYKIGSCYNMQDDLCYYIIFINDNESHWNENDKSEFVEKKFVPSINYLSLSCVGRSLGWSASRQGHLVYRRASCLGRVQARP